MCWRMGTKTDLPATDPANVVAAKPERFASKRPPTQSARALWTWTKTAVDNFNRINGTTWASSFAYYAFFALVPLLLLLLTVGTDVAAKFMGAATARRLAAAGEDHLRPPGFQQGRRLAGDAQVEAVALGGADRLVDGGGHAAAREARRLAEEDGRDLFLAQVLDRAARGNDRDQLARLRAGASEDQCGGRGQA